MTACYKDLIFAGKINTLKANNFPTTFRTKCFRTNFRKFLHGISNDRKTIYFQFTFAYCILKMSYIDKWCFLLGMLGQSFPEIIIFDSDKNDCQDEFSFKKFDIMTIMKKDCVHTMLPNFEKGEKCNR